MTDEQNESEAKPNLFIPEDILKQLSFFCESNDLGMILFGNSAFCITLIGKREYSLSQTSLAAAQMLISSVMNDISRAAGEVHHDLNEVNRGAKVQ